MNAPKRREKEVNAVARSLGLAAAYFLSAFPAQGACPEISEWLSLKEKASYSSLSLRERSELREREELARRRSAHLVFDSYMANHLDAEGLSACLAPHSDRQNFRNTMQAVFYERTIDLLRRAKEGPIRELVRRIDALSEGRAPMWRLVGHFRNESGIGPRAGFHRASGGLYMNFSEIKPDEWPIIFIHEVLHSLDDILPGAMDAYSVSEKVAKIAAAAHESPTLAALPRPIAIDLEQWLEAGLERGLFAEYRAWLFTFVLYEQGVQEKLWPRIDWIEKILRAKPQQLSLGRYTYLYLDERSSDPREGMFSLPLVQAALRDLRERYRTGHKEPRLGRLVDLLK